jgi:hypothetical protein
MSVFGISAPKIVLVNAKGETKATYTLATPPKGCREFDWVPESDPRINPLTKTLLPRIFGYRGYLKLRYYGLTYSTTIEDLVEIANTGYRIKIFPHSDQVAISFWAKVTDFKCGSHDGYAKNEFAEVEFQAEELRSTVPNPDTFYAISVNKAIYTTP